MWHQNLMLRGEESTAIEKHVKETGVKAVNLKDAHNRPKWE